MKHVCNITIRNIPFLYKITQGYNFNLFEKLIKKKKLKEHFSGIFNPSSIFGQFLSPYKKDRKTQFYFESLKFKI